MLNPQNLNELARAIAEFAVRVGSASGLLIQNMEVNPTTGTLDVLYSNGQTVSVGVVKGGDGEDGASITNVELYEDPLENNDVFIQTSLSNGIVLRTQNSLNGYHGKSIRDAYLENDQLFFELDDAEGTTLTPIAISGLKAISVVGVVVRDDGNGPEMFWQLSNNTEVSSGLAEDLRGRGIVSLVKTAGKLYARYTDAPTTDVEVGSVNGVTALGVVDGSLVAYYDNAPETPIVLGALSMVTGATVVGGELIFTTNQPAPNNTINVGPVDNLRGNDGDSVIAVRLVDGALIFTVTGGVDLPPVSVEGLTPTSVVGARFDEVEDELYLILSTGTEIPSGLSSEIRGRGIVQSTVDATGKLYFHYSTDPATPVQVGVLPAIINSDLFEGQLRVYYNTAPTTPVPIGQLLSFSGMRMSATGELFTIFTNGNESSIGFVKAVNTFTISAGDLVVTYNSGQSVNLGRVVGATGANGIGFVDATVSPAGDLLIERSDGGQVNAGSVRSTLQNLMGTITLMTAEENQTVFPIEHSDTAIVILNGVIVSDADLDYSITEQITYTGPALAAGDALKFVTFGLAGESENGKGISSVGLVSGSTSRYYIRLENGDEFTIETATPVEIGDLPPGIQSLIVLPNGNLQVTLTNGDIQDAGPTSNAINLVNAYIDANGDLHVVLSDTTNINVGSVLSSLTVVDATIVDGELIIEFSDGGTFNAGMTGLYVTGATINASDELEITLSNNTVLNAGVVRNPLLGTIYDFVAVDGQFEFPVLHAGFKVLVAINGSTLTEPSIDLTTPYVRVTVPRASGDLVRIVMFSTGATAATSIVGIDTAPNGTFYGKNDAGVVGFHPAALTALVRPYTYVAGANQTAFDVPHSGANSVAVYVNGERRAGGMSYPDGLVIFTTPMVGGESVVIDLLRPARGAGDLLISNYARIAYDTYGYGGSFNGGAWRVRALNAIVTDSIGITLDSNRMLLPGGTYYVKGYAACVGVRQNVPRLFNQTYSQELLMGSPQFAPPVSVNNNGAVDTQTPIEGYFTIPSQSAIVLQHKCVSSYATFGFGRGNAMGYAPGTTVAANSLGVPGRLVDLQFWKIA